MSDLWTIDDLAVLAEKALESGDYNGQTSGRVRAVPDARTIRYYTTLGLIDPPAEMRGRKAFYTRRHVLQLAAIKRLQSRGYTLPQVQEALVGADGRALARWAGLKGGFWADAAENLRPKNSAPRGTVSRSVEPANMRSAESELASAPTRQRFWAEPAGQAGSEAAAPAARAVVHVPVCDGVELVIEGVDPTRIGPALASMSPLLKQLADTLQALRQTSDVSAEKDGTDADADSRAK